jgi:hypothetical protein
MAEESAQFSAFISYASPDRAKAEEVCASLEAHGFSCWIAPRNIRAGHDYADAIIHGIHASKCLVLILSAAANESHFVHREVERAVSNNKMVFPLRIQEVLPSAALELFVSSAHWIDAWHGKLDEHIAHLARDLADDGSTPPAALGPAPAAAHHGSQKILIFAAVAVLVVGAAIFLASRIFQSAAPAVVTQPVASVATPVVAPAPVPQVSVAPTPPPLPPVPRPVQPIAPVVVAPPPPFPKPRGAFQLTPAATPDGQEPLTVFESYRSQWGKMEYQFLCPPNTAMIRVSYDGRGYFETPAQPNPRPYPVTLNDWPAGDHLKLIFRTADGTETGPFDFAPLDRQSIMLQTLKNEFLTGSPEALECYLVPFTLPFTDDPKQELAAAQAETDPTARQQLLQTYRATLQQQNGINAQLRSVACSFVATAPTVACTPNPRISAMAWAAVKEVHIGVQTGQTQTVIPVNIDWDEFLKLGNQYFADAPDLVRLRFKVWNATVPPDSTDVYATFIFRDGTSSDEMRFRVDTTRLHQ